MTQIASLVASNPSPDHEGKKSFKCDICDLSFELKTNLCTHIDSVHEGKEPCSTNDSETFSFKYVTAGSVTRIIKRLKNTKSLRIDEIQTDVWKKGVAVLASPIA